MVDTASLPHRCVVDKLVLDVRWTVVAIRYYAKWREGNAFSGLVSSGSSYCTVASCREARGFKGFSSC